MVKQGRFLCHNEMRGVHTDVWDKNYTPLPYVSFYVHALLEWVTADLSRPVLHLVLKDEQGLNRTSCHGQYKSLKTILFAL